MTIHAIRPQQVAAMSTPDRMPQSREKTTLTNESEISKLSQNLSRGEWTPTYDFIVKTARGGWIQDIEGRWYLDFLSSASSAALGYRNQALIDVVTSSLTNLSQACSFYTPHASLNEFIQTVSNTTPGKFEKAMLFGLSGSDAMEGALKATSRFRESKKFLAFKNSYHGSTLASRAVSGFTGLPGSNNAQASFLEFPRNNVEAEATLEKFQILTKREKYAALCVEPIQGDSGNIVPPKSFLSKLAALSKEVNVPIIADEIQTGMGRTGRIWACEHFGLIPDLLIAGKGITSGYFPLSYCIGRREIIQALKPAEHVFTYSAHPTACAVASKVLQIISNDGILKNVNERGAQLKIGLSAIKLEFQQKIKIKIKGIGLQMAMDVYDEEGPLSTALVSLALRSGLLLGLFGNENQTARLHPPLIVTHEEVDQALDVIHRAIHTLSLLEPRDRRNLINNSQTKGGLSAKAFGEQK